MNSVAVKMLLGERGKYLGILMGVTFASLLITHQQATFLGIMTRFFSTITDLSQPDIWVVDPKVQFIDDIKPLQDTMLQRVRGIEGVEWAVPLYKGMLKARLPDGTFQSCNVLGLDDATLIGGPPKMIQGDLADLRQADAVIVDTVGAESRLARPAKTPGGQPIPLAIGDTLELNDRRAVVVGICKVSESFQRNPVIYTTYTRAVAFAPGERKLLSFVLVKAKAGQDQKALCDRINAATGLMAMTADEFKAKTLDYFFKFTPIPINLGVAMVLSFIIGTAISGLMFYTFTLENLRYFGTLKAMGATNALLFRMISLQALTVGFVGFGLGVGASAALGYLMSSNSTVAWQLHWLVLVFTGLVVMVICVLSAAMCIRKVMKLEPAIVFR